MHQQIEQINDEIRVRLQRVKLRSNQLALLDGTISVALVVVTLVMILVVFENLLHLGVVARTVAFWSVILISGGVTLWRVGLPLLKLVRVLPSESDARTAARVGGAHPQIKDRLLNAVQLYDEQKLRPGYYSADFICGAFVDLDNEARTIDFAATVKFADVWPLGRSLVAVGVVGIVLAGVFPEALMGAATRLWQYDTAFATPLPFSLVIEPGNREVLKGRDVEIHVRAVGKVPEQVMLVSRPEGQIAFEEQTMVLAADRTFRYTFQSLKASTRYYVRSGPVRSEEFLLHVYDRPTMKLLQLQLKFPTYAALPPRQLDDNVGDVLALKGTLITFTIESSKDLSAATLVFNDGSTVPLHHDGRAAHGDIRLIKERKYHILLTDIDTTRNTDPVEYSLRIDPDRFPTASILVPGANLDLAENGRLNMLFKITDDFGFTGLRLAQRLVHSRYEQPAEKSTYVPVPIPAETSNEAVIPFVWNLKTLSLVPEDVVEYYIEVFDNDNVSGPKSAVSEIFTVRLPSLDEIFAELDRKHDVSSLQLEEALQQAREARKELEDLRQRLLQNQKRMEWEERKQSEAVVQRYEEIQAKIEEVSRVMDQMTRDLERNQLLSPETLQKYMELQSLLQEINSPEFAEAMKRLQQAMQKLDPEDVRRALEEMNLSEEAFRQSIERTINLLKRIQIEQKIEEMLRRTDAMKQNQEEFRNLTQQLDPNDAPGRDTMIRQQADLQEQFDHLSKGVADLQQRMQEFPGEMPLKEMENARASLAEGGLEDDLQRIIQELQQKRMVQAADGQLSAAQKMGQFMEQMTQVQKSLQSNQQRQIVNEMRRALRDFLELSRRQEMLKVESGLSLQNSPRMRDLAQQQADLMRDLAGLTDRLAALSQKTFGVTPEMGRSIGDAVRAMREALESLERRNGPMAGDKQGSAMASLNQAAQQVQWALNAMMQGGQGMGMAGFMQRLRELSGQQQGVNEGTRNLGSMTQQQMAALARLAGEQGAVRKSLEQLAREAAGAGELSKLLGDLSTIAQEMREVQTDLAQGDVNPETLQKQERILSRLLDSQRSMRERDFERRRRAEEGTNVVRRGPGEIDLSSQEGRDRLRQDLLKALEEGYARDYRELIRKYFEVLER